MMYMCKPIPKETIVTMYDERVAELEHLLSVEQEKSATLMKQNDRLSHDLNNAQANANTTINILAGISHYFASECGLTQHHVDSAIAYVPEPSWKVLEVLEYNEAVPSHMLKREYEVTITVPVTVCVTVEACDAETAEEMARDDVESNGIEYFSMEYNLYYDAEYEVTEA